NDVIRRRRLQLVAVSSDVVYLQRIQHQRLRTVVRDDQSQHKEAVFAVVDVEDRSMRRPVVRIDGYVDLLVIMTFDLRIGLAMSCRRRVEPPVAGQRQAGEHCQEGRKSSRTHRGRLSATEPVFTTGVSGE